MDGCRQSVALLAERVKDGKFGDTQLDELQKLLKELEQTATYKNSMKKLAARCRQEQLMMMTSSS